MRIPKEIDILGTKYTVQYRVRVDSDNSDGLCDHKNRKILLNKFLTKEEKTQVFLHECFHAVLWEAGISRSLDENLEECTVDSLSKWVNKMLTLRLTRK